MPSQGIKRTGGRRQTIPLRKSDTEYLFDYFLNKQKLKTLPSERDVNTGVQHVQETTSITTTDDDIQQQQQQQLKRTDSYRKATHPITIYKELDEMAPSPFQFDKVQMFKKDDYDKRKYRTLPPESPSTKYNLRKRKSGQLETKETNNNNYKCEKSQYRPERSGSIASSDSDDEDDISVSTIDRKKKSAFQKAKERIFHTFRMQKKTEDQKNKSKEKTKQKSKKKLKKGHSKGRQSEVVVMDEHGHCESHVSQSKHGDILVRREESLETTDYVTPSFPSVHTQSHTRVTDTTDLSTRTKSTPIARLRKSVRRRFSDASKSPKEEKKSGVISNDGCPGQGKRNPRRQTPLSPPSNQGPIGQFRQPDNAVTKVFEAIISPDFNPNAPSRPLRPSRGKYGNKGDRSKLGLYGLTPCYTDSLPTSGNFEADVVSDTHREYVRSPDGHMEVITDKHETIHVCPMDVDDLDIDCPDGCDRMVKSPQGNSGHEEKTRLGRRSSSKKSRKEDALPFDQLSEEGKSKRIESVANRLATIADNYVTRTETESSQSDMECQSPTRPVPGPLERLTSVERDFVLELRKEGDRLSDAINIPATIMPIAMQLVKETDQYSRFSQVVKSSLNGTVGWHNVAMYFYVTKAAVHMAGAGGAVAYRLKDMAIKYFSDTFANWVIDRGGWDSVLEETDSELD